MDYPPIPLDHHCSVLRFESPGIWALEKAAGVLSHPNKESKKIQSKEHLLMRIICKKMNATSGQTIMVKFKNFI